MVLVVSFALILGFVCVGCIMHSWDLVELDFGFGFGYAELEVVLLGALGFGVLWGGFGFTWGGII